MGKTFKDLKKMLGKIKIDSREIEKSVRKRPVPAQKAHRDKRPTQFEDDLEP
jgi:hypothetical protein